jgi:hypothetical protein
LLNKVGIHFIVLQHLPETYLDGACFFAPDGSPVFDLTLRHDRMDNFWFTIVHELAHLYLDLDGGNIAFFDDTEQPVDDPGTDKLLPTNLYPFLKQFLCGCSIANRTGLEGFHKTYLSLD